MSLVSKTNNYSKPQFTSKEVLKGCGYYVISFIKESTPWCVVYHFKLIEYTNGLSMHTYVEKSAPYLDSRKDMWEGPLFALKKMQF